MDMYKLLTLVLILDFGLIIAMGTIGQASVPAWASVEGDLGELNELAGSTHDRIATDDSMDSRPSENELEAETGGWSIPTAWNNARAIWGFMTKQTYSITETEYQLGGGNDLGRVLAWGVSFFFGVLHVWLVLTLIRWARKAPQ